MDSDFFSVDQSALALFDLDPVKRASGGEEAPSASEAEDLDSFNLIEPPPLDWRSDSSSEAGSADVLDDPSLGLLGLGGLETPPLAVRDALIQLDTNQELLENVAEPEVQPKEDNRVVEEEILKNDEKKVGKEKVGVSNRRPGDEDHSRIHTLLSQLQLMEKEPLPGHRTPSSDHHGPLEQEAHASSVSTEDRTGTTGLLFSDSHHRDLLGLLQCTEISDPSCLPHRGQVDAVVSVSYSQEDAQAFWGQNSRRQRDDSVASLPDDEYPEPVWMKLGEEPPEDDAAADSDQVGAKTAKILVPVISMEHPFFILKHSNIYLIIFDYLLNKPNFLIFISQT